MKGLSFTLANRRVDRQNPDRPGGGLSSWSTWKAPCVGLDFASLQLGDTIEYYLDTLRADYAFIISLYPVPKNLPQSSAQNTIAETWNFNMFPNPTRTEVSLVLPVDGVPKDIVIYDLSGKLMRTFGSKGDQFLNISTTGFAKGLYCVRVSDQSLTRMKTLIIQ